MRNECIYLQVMVQMYLKGWDCKKLCEETGLNYTSIRRKLRGISPLRLDEAKKIQKALDCGLSLDALFCTREKQAA